MAEAAPAPVDPVAAIASLIGHARALAPNLCPSLYPAGFPSDVTDILLSKGLDPAVIAKQLQAAGNCIAACAPQDSRIISVFAIDASRRTFKFSGLQAVPADVASFAHCDICTNEIMSGSGCGAADALQRWAAANKIKSNPPLALQTALNCMLAAKTILNNMRCTVVDKAGAPLSAHHFGDAVAAAAAAALQAAPAKSGKKRK